MTYQEFKNKYNGRPLDFDGFYGYQCMDLAQFYNKEVVNGARLMGNAKDVWDTYPQDKYTKIANTPTGVPLKGDIVIWKGMPGNQYGHIAVFDNGNVNSFVSFDQNWPVGSYCHLQNHNYNYVLGWLHPKQVPVEKQISSTQLLGIINGAGSDGDKLLKIRTLCL